MDILALGKATTEKELLEKNLERIKEELKMRDSTIYSLRSNNEKINVINKLNNYLSYCKEKQKMH